LERLEEAKLKYNLLETTIAAEAKNLKTASDVNVFMELSKALRMAVPKDTFTHKDVSPFTAEIPKSRSELQSMKSTTTILSGEQSAGVTVPGFGGVKLSKNEVNLNAYYIERRTVKTDHGPVMYGIGYSVHYLFKKIKRGISVSNLAAVAASVQLEGNKTEVFYSIQSYGMRGTPLVKFFAPAINKKFDVEGFSFVQSNVDGIQHILGDDQLSKGISFEPEEIKFIKENDF